MYDEQSHMRILEMQIFDMHIFEMYVLEYGSKVNLPKMQRSGIRRRDEPSGSIHYD